MTGSHAATPGSPIVPTGEYRMTTSDVAGLVVHQHGDDADLVPVVFVHPVNTSAEVWFRLAELLAPRRCVALDMRGHGASKEVPGPFRLDDYADDIMRMVDDLGLERMHVVGGSLGGPIAVALAAAHPERVCSVTSLGGSLTLNPGQEVLDELAAALAAAGTTQFWQDYAPDILGSGYPPRVFDDFVRIAASRPVETIVAIIQGAFTTDITERAELVRCPTLVINGAHDPTCTPEMGREMALRTGGSFVELSHLGHLPMMEAPGMIADRLVRHFALAEEAT